MTEKLTPVEDGETVIIGNFEVSHQLTQQRTMRVTGYIYNKDTPEAINARIDIMQDAMDRQFIRCDVVNKEAQEKATMAALENHRQVIDDLIKKRDEGKKLSSQEKQTIDRWDDNLRNGKAQMASLRSAIAEGRKKLNGASHA